MAREMEACFFVCSVLPFFAPLLFFPLVTTSKQNISRPLYLLRYGVNLSILLTEGKEIK
jgi:hypothetical protein